MKSLLHFLAPPGPCGYLPHETWRLEYEFFSELSAAEYLTRMENGWRRFGVGAFRPQCPACNACRSLRVLADRFRPNRSQRRVRKANERTIRLEVGLPCVTRAKLDLYDRYHAFQAESKGWPWHEAKDVASYSHSFVDNPFPTEEWCYYLGDRLVGVAYVDVLPGPLTLSGALVHSPKGREPGEEGALSAIYFFYDPDERPRSLGTWNVLNVIDRARQARIPYVYLGYFVKGCPSMEYKATFTPNQIRDPDGSWRDFRTG